MMKKTCFTWIAILLSLVIGMSSCIPMQDDGDATGSTGGGYLPLKPRENVYETAVYTYAMEVDESLLTTFLDPAYLLLANKQTVLGKDYVPAQLETLPSSVTPKSIQLDRRAAQALCEMMDAMRAAGINDTWVTSAYRSYAYQEQLFEQYFKKESTRISTDAYAYFGEDYIRSHYLMQNKSALSEEDAIAVVLSYSAAPGTSEHQTGLCVDLITNSMTELDATFELTAAFAWLSQNAHQYGFILRYPKGKETITGYSYEPWHYRFVGREAATDMYFLGLTLEEYLVPAEG